MAPWTNIRSVLAFMALPDPTPDPAPEDGDISKLISEIGKDPVCRGGFCDLYLGQHRHHGKVALRRPRHVSYDEATIRRFHREVGLLCKVTHNNILPFLGTYTNGSDIYMVSPFIKNGDLRQWIEKGRPLNRVEILYQIADALAHLHDKGIVHGDIKAQNVLVSDEETALLCDFGLAKALDSMVTSTDVKGQGSSRWMAPELFENAPKSKESDVYALGIMIAEVLTGKKPLDHIRGHAILTQVRDHNARPLRPEAFGEDDYDILWTTAERCWAKIPSDRPLATDITRPTPPTLKISNDGQQDPLQTSGCPSHVEAPSNALAIPGAEPLDPGRALSPPSSWVMINDFKGPC